MNFVEDRKAQIEQAFQSLTVVHEAAGPTLADAIDVTTFHTAASNLKCNTCFV